MGVDVLMVLTGLRLYTLVQVVFLRVPQTLLQNVYKMRTFLKPASLGYGVNKQY